MMMIETLDIDLRIFGEQQNKNNNKNTILQNQNQKQLL
jgi:hypothetical protein